MLKTGQIFGTIQAPKIYKTSFNKNIISKLCPYGVRFNGKIRERFPRRRRVACSQFTAF